jgi:hypothetical protein
MYDAVRNIEALMANAFCWLILVAPMEDALIAPMANNY